MEKSCVSSRFGTWVEGGFRSQVRERRVPGVANYSFSGVGFSCYGRGTVNHAQKHDPDRSTRCPCCISGDGDHDFPADFSDSQEPLRAVGYAHDAGTISSTSVPAPTSLQIASLPPISLARSRMPGKP